MRSRLTGKLRRILPYLLCAALAVACSSVPRGPVEVHTARRRAETQLELALKEASRGNYTRAQEMLAEGRRIAIASDDPVLLVRTSLAGANIRFALGAEDAARDDFEHARRRAQESGDATLIALCGIYEARWKLLTQPHDRAATVRDQALAAAQTLGKNSGDTAFALNIAALADKALGNYAAAEASLKKARAIHLEHNQLEAAAYDWYLSASVFSVAGQTGAAVAAIHEAINLDRKAENGFGLGMDYLGLGDIYLKAKARNDAIEAYERAAAIFSASGFELDAQIAAEKAAALQAALIEE
ncbi:MAG: hypothetical protein LBD22_06395 [Spirochaetaceae bacterium]|nr:hypothetical protein [Spirochaetaceae bacterium]